MDLQKVINEQTEKYIQEKLEETIQKHLEKMMDEVLGDIFSRYGDNSKIIKQAISEQINIDLKYLDLMDYNGVIASVVEKHFAKLVQERSCEPILKILSTIVGDPYPKDTISLDYLFKEISDIFEEDAEYGDDIIVPFYAEYNEKHGWVNCWTDDNQDTEKEDCKIKFTFSKNGSIFSLQFLNRSGDQRSPIDLVGLGAVEKLIHKIYTSGVKITIDGDWDDGEIEFDREFTKEY